MPALQSIYADITELRFVGPALDMMFNDLKVCKNIVITITNPL